MKTNHYGEDTLIAMYPDGFARCVRHNGQTNFFTLEKDGQIVAQSFSSYQIAVLHDRLAGGDLNTGSIPAEFTQDLSVPQPFGPTAGLQLELQLAGFEQRGVALRIDIEEELKAIERGECALCRISARHPDDTSCQKGLEINHMWDNRGPGCDCCAHSSIPGWFYHAGAWMHCPQCNPVHIGQYLRADNEPVIRNDYRGRWEYVYNTATGDRRYLHMDCDVLTNDEGYCIACGAPCPSFWGGKTS